MKKLLILSVLLGLMALPMFASDITFGGDLKYGFIGDFGDDFSEATDITFDIKAAIDDYSSLTINVDGLETQVDGLGLNGGRTSPAIWTAAKLEDTFGIVHNDLIREINEFVHKRCPKRLKELGH